MQQHTLLRVFFSFTYFSILSKFFSFFCSVMCKIHKLQCKSRYLNRYLSVIFYDVRYNAVM